MCSSVNTMICVNSMAIPIPWKPSNSVPTKTCKLQKICPSFHCINANPTDDQISTITRRSGNYNPTLWDFHFIQSLTTTEYREERHVNRVWELVAEVKMILEKETEGVGQLELIDMLQNMAISYHFDHNIKHILSSMHHGKWLEEEDRDLYSTALFFRLLRQNGFTVPQELFDRFKENGEFKASLEEDTKGVLQLYEASFLLTQGEETLEAARLFSTRILQKKIKDGLIDDIILSSMVRRSLELPLHWTLQSLNARWFIQAYADIINPIVVELAKLEFNILQQTYQQELKQVSRWWEHTGLARNMPFARDRVVECFLWAVSELPEPQYGYERIINTKIVIMITIVDDMFDVYGTLDELELFNHIIQKWDIEAMEQLPECMQICFLALNNFINEIAYDVLQQQGSIIIPYLRKSWADLCRAYTKQARWYNEGYKPSVKEFIDNGWISIGAPVMMTHEYFLHRNPIVKEDVETLYQYHNILRFSSTITRLANDLATSQDEIERGDVPKSIDCYMIESGANREEAEEYVRCSIRQTWKNINEERVKDCPFSPNFVESVINVGRVSHFMYQHGDGHGVQNLEFKRRISALLFEPIH